MTPAADVTADVLNRLAAVASNTSSGFATISSAEIELLMKENESLWGDRAELHKVSKAIAPLGAEFMDPPDGGNVGLGEYVTRVVAALQAARKKDPVLAIAERELKNLEAEVKRLAEANAALLVEKANVEDALNTNAVIMGRKLDMLQQLNSELGAGRKSDLLAITDALGWAREQSGRGLPPPDRAVTALIEERDKWKDRALKAEEGRVDTKLYGIAAAFVIAVQDERRQQDQKWGKPKRLVVPDAAESSPELHRMQSVLTEEVGELAQALLDWERHLKRGYKFNSSDGKPLHYQLPPREYFTELIQCAAVLQKIWEMLVTRENVDTVVAGLKR